MVAPLIIGAAIGAGAGLLGSGIDAQISRSSASAQMGFQERAFRNRYQWQMEDMKRAGLNPILAYKQGAPAGPAGAGYTSDYSRGIAGGVNSGLAYARARDELKAIRAQAANVTQDTVNKEINQEILDINRATAYEQYLQEKNNTYRSNADRLILEHPRGWDSYFLGTIAKNLNPLIPRTSYQFGSRGSLGKGRRRLSRRRK